ncbi:MAG: DinB family protein [Thermoplasmata archaeon]|nr:DinB family protein [Thermoplasmata archaeon]
MGRPLRFPVEDASTISAYNRAVFERFVRRARRLPKKGAMRRRGIGHESLFLTLVHILNVQEVWLVYIVRGRNSDEELEALFNDPTRHPKDWKEFDAYAARVWSGVEETIEGLTTRDLDRTIRVFWMPGRYTVRDGLLQATIEEAHHLGEVIGALWQDDREPPDMTWIDVRRTPAPNSPRRSR